MYNQFLLLCILQENLSFLPAQFVVQHYALTKSLAAQDERKEEAISDAKPEAAAPKKKRSGFFANLVNAFEGQPKSNN